MGENVVKKYSMLIFTLAMILLGLADLIGLLPDSLDLLDKVLTSLLLLFFWWKLNLSKFMFGRSTVLTNVFILIGFYLLIMPTFLEFISISETAGFVLTMVSIIGGTVALIILSIFLTLRYQFGDKSMFHSIISIFSKKDSVWNKISKKGQSPGFMILKLILTYLILFIISQYFFGLVNQWFIVSLDKSLFFVAIIFAIKDLEQSKSKALQSLGKVDDLILGKISELFTTPKLLYLGFGFLLIFHYLSDLATFLFPYVFGLGKEPFFFDKLEVISPGLHEPLSALGMGTGLFETLASILSSVGLIFLILVPILLCFFIVYKVKFNKIVENKLFTTFLIIAFVSIVAFFLIPWTSVASIPTNDFGIYGVDFLTFQLSSVAFLGFGIVLLIVGLIFLLSLFAYNSKVGKYLLVVVYLISMIYLGQFVLNYFISSISYYGPQINFLSSHLFSSYNSIAFLSLITLAFLDLLFYIGGFMLFAYFSSKYLIKQVIRDLINDTSIYIWTFILLLVPLLLFLNPNPLTMVISSIVIIVFFIFSYAMFQELSGAEKRDDYILGVNLSIIIYQILGIIIYFFSGTYEGLLNFIAPFIILVLALFAIFYFKIYIDVKDFKWRDLSLAIIMGLLFGVIFWGISEPGTVLLGSGVGLFFSILIFTFVVAVAEELLFRGALLTLARRAFKFEIALVLQAIVFALIHFAAAVTVLWAYYSTTNINFFGVTDVTFFFVYMIMLFFFGLVAGLFVRKKEGNILYPIVIHWIANFVVLITYAGFL
ncbi:lysostaphin resistance A-like protein [Nanoarchaeota archaeon]